MAVDGSQVLGHVVLAGPGRGLVEPRLGEPPPGLRVTALSVQPASVRLVAAPELLALLREVPGTVPYREGTYTTPVTLRVPAGAQALEEVSVRLTVEAAPPSPASSPSPAPAASPPAGGAAEPGRAP